MAISAVFLYGYTSCQALFLCLSSLFRFLVPLPCPCKSCLTLSVCAGLILSAVLSHFSVFLCSSLFSPSVFLHRSLYHFLFSSLCLTLFPYLLSLLHLPSWASPVAQLVKNLPAMQETWVRSLGWKNPLEKGKATHSSILAWRIPWTGHKESDTTKRLSLCFTSPSSFFYYLTFTLFLPSSLLSFSVFLTSLSLSVCVCLVATSVIL